MAVTVAKFGGAVLRDADGVLAVCREIAALPRPLLVVVSAFATVTNRLEEIARTAIESPESAAAQYRSLIALHNDIASSLLDPPRYGVWRTRIEPMLGRLEEVIEGLGIVGELSARTLDLVVHFGERLSSSIVEAVLRAGGTELDVIGALDLVITDDTHRYARPNLGIIASRVEERMLPSLERIGLVLTEGYIARGVSGEVTTMGRESSDYTATLLGRLVAAREVRLYTRVPGIMTADPSRIEEARTIPAMGYRTARALSELGVKVLHPRTVGPVEEGGIRLIITDLEGHETTIGKEGGGSCAVAVIDDARVVCVQLPTVRADVMTLLGRLSEFAPVLWHHQFRHALQIVTASDIEQGRFLAATAGYTITDAIPTAVVSLVRSGGITAADYRIMIDALDDTPPIAVQGSIDGLSVSVAIRREHADRITAAVHRSIQ